MHLQLLSDLHLESETFDPEPAPGADLLVLAGDIDRHWGGLEAFRGWPVPMLFVPGNHEFDGRDLHADERALRERCEALGMVWLHRQVVTLPSLDGVEVRFVGTIRWSDFDAFGPAKRDRAMRSARYFVDLMRSTIDDRPLDAQSLRAEGLACRAWLEAALSRPTDGPTVVVTHFAPSLLSADPRYGMQPSTASFCNADDDLIARADLWLHGHLHCRRDYAVERPGRAPTRVVCNARGLSAKGEDAGWDPMRLIEVPGARRPG